jgi:hypothetical protein
MWEAYALKQHTLMAGPNLPAAAAVPAPRKAISPLLSYRALKQRLALHRSTTIVEQCFSRPSYALLSTQTRVTHHESHTAPPISTHAALKIYKRPYTEIRATHLQRTPRHSPTPHTCSEATIVLKLSVKLRLLCSKALVEATPALQQGSH